MFGFKAVSSFLFGEEETTNDAQLLQGREPAPDPRPAQPAAEPVASPPHAAAANGEAAADTAAMSFDVSLLPRRAESSPPGSEVDMKSEIDEGASQTDMVVVAALGHLAVTPSPSPTHVPGALPVSLPTYFAPVGASTSALPADVVKADAAAEEQKEKEYVRCCSLSPLSRLPLTAACHPLSGIRHSCCASSMQKSSCSSGRRR
jgi:hypothetical protein